MTITFFKNILASINHDITHMSVEYIREIHSFKCSSNLASQLTRIPTNEEIKVSFFKMPKCKAHGPYAWDIVGSDAWDIVGSDAIKAVRNSSFLDECSGSSTLPLLLIYLR